MRSTRFLTCAAPAHVALALALLAPRLAAQQTMPPYQDCVDAYLASRSGTQYLTNCSITGQQPCQISGFDVYRVQGGGNSLQTLIMNLQLATTFTVIDVGPDLQPPPVQEVYDPIFIQASWFPNGLAIISRWGPQFAAIDGGGVAQCVNIETGGGGLNGPDGPIRIGAAANRLVLNAPPQPDYDGWHGFEIRNGVAPAFFGGGGVIVNNVDSDVDIAGNVIHDNQGRNSGGGVYLFGASNAYLALNHIHHNVIGSTIDPGLCGYEETSPLRGAGVLHLLGDAQLIGNRIENNGFGADLCATSMEPARQGGGVAFFTISEGGASSHFACGNNVVENSATEGNGYWVDLDVAAAQCSARLELNEISQNTTWQPNGNAVIAGGIRGGGVFLRGRSTPIKSSSTPVLQVQLVANRIAENSVANPGLSPAVPGVVGGGVYSDVERNDASDEVALVGNAIWGNQAELQGAGAWVRHPSTVAGTPSGELHHNTIAWNELSSTSGRGAGIYLAGSTRFRGSSAILYDNSIAGSPNGPDSNWYGVPGIPDRFVFTQMTSVTTGADLFDAATSSTLDPLLVPGDWHVTGNSPGTLGSPCLDSADPSIEPALVALMMVPRDADDGPREVDRLPGGSDDRDRGADEFLSFLRGDANADGNLNLADSVYLLSYLFSGGPAPLSADAADVDDNGSINIADVIRLNEHLFPSMPPPPNDPVGMCLIEDPTPDALVTEPGTPCIP